jgi:hypothetical protein
MAADAVARQYDVDKNRVLLFCEPGKGGYRPGTITFHPKPGKSIDLRKIEESLRATRLSGGTAMSVDALEITVSGEVVIGDGRNALIKVAGLAQPMLLSDRGAKEAKRTPLRLLYEEVMAGKKIVSVTGNVEGWSGRFPAVLAALGKQGIDAPWTLVVTGFDAK